MFSKLISLTSLVVELLLSQKDEIFKPLQQYLQQIHDAFMNKCSRIRQLQDDLTRGLDHFPLPPIAPTLATASDETNKVAAVVTLVWLELIGTSLLKSAQNFQ